MHVRELFDLSGRSAIVTGGGSGIGRQLALGLAEAGADVVVCARRVDRCESVAKEIERLGVRSKGLECDVRSEPCIERVVRQAREELGRIDILVNSAGIAWVASPEEMPPAEWKRVLDVNLTGTFLFCQAAGRVMIDQGGGKIVNIASVAGLRGLPAEILNAVGYQTSKGAVITLTQDLACKWARHGINVNAIVPGWFPTELTARLVEKRRDALLSRIPFGRLGDEHDLKGAVVYLASAASGFVTGQTLVVDGGESAW
jgi:gluconate 5-dehydrogenase